MYIYRTTEKSLEWESYEQSCLWTFIISEFGYYLDNSKFILQLFIDEKVKFTKGRILKIIIIISLLLFVKLTIKIIIYKKLKYDIYKFKYIIHELKYILFIYYAL